MPSLTFSSLPLPLRLLWITTLFAMIQALRLLAMQAGFWQDALLQVILAPLLFYFFTSWRLRMADLWPGHRDGLYGILAGLVAGMALFLILYLTTPRTGSTTLAEPSLVKTALLVPIVEEVYFRLVLTGALKQGGLSSLWTIILNGLFFALAHQYSVAPFLFSVGLAAGWLFLRFGLLASLSMHVIYNLAILLHAMS